LFTLLVHEEPFAHKGSNYLSVLNAILNDPPRALAAVRSDGAFSPELEQLIQDCLAKKPENRPISMTEVEARFEQCFPDDPSAPSLPPSGSYGIPHLEAGKTNRTGGARTGSSHGTSTFPNRQPRRRLVGSVAAALVAVGGLAFFMTHPRPESKPTPEPVLDAPPPAGQKSVLDASPVGQKPPLALVAGPPLQLNDDRYIVVRNRTLKTDDASGKNKNQNRSGVLANDGLPTGKSYDVECVDKPKFGELNLNRDGTFTYACAARPGGELVRSDTFRYRVRAADHDPWSDPAVVTIAIRAFSDEEESAMKHIAATYGDATIRTEPNPPGVELDFSEPNVRRRIRDDSLNVLDPLVEVAREVRLDSQPITDSAIEHLERFGDLRILSLAGTDVSDAGTQRILAFKSLSEVDLSDTLVTDGAVAALAADHGKKVPLRVVRDGPIDRLRSAGVAIAGKNDATLGRNGFVATVPRADQFQKVVPLLREAPRLVGLVLTNSDVSDELVTENLVRQLKFLQAMDLRGTIVSPPHVSLLRTQFPGLKMQWDPPLTQLRLVGNVKDDESGVSIDFAGKKIDGRSWILLTQVEKLNTLNLSGIPIDDSAFERLVQLNSLRQLTLEETGLAGQRILELCRRLPSLVSLDVQKSAIARDKVLLRAILAELRGHDRIQGSVRPEPVDEGPDLLVAPFDEAAADRARAGWAAFLNSPEATTNTTGIKLLLIPPGEFRMGSEETYLELVDRFPNVREAEEENPVSRLGLESARPQRTVRITKPFYLSAHEVTNGQFKKFIAARRAHSDKRNQKQEWGLSTGQAPNLQELPVSEGQDVPTTYWGMESNDKAPVVNVSWHEAVAFCEWLSRTEGKIYRLPTEAEWEYACRAGTVTRYWNGDDPEHLTQIANVRDLTARNKFGWQNTLNSSDGSVFTSDVGRYPPNHFGLFDMLGNAAEWCSDWFSPAYYREPVRADPAGPSMGALRVVRGGSWHSSAIFCRSAHRAAEPPSRRSNRLGFRVVCVGTKAPWPPAPAAVATPAKGLAPPPLVAPFKEEQIDQARKEWVHYAQIDEGPTNSSGMTLMLIPPGEFLMGSTLEEIERAVRFDASFKKESANRELPLHRVRITRPFYLAAHEVTLGQFRRFIRGTGYKTVAERAGGKGNGFDQATGKFKTDKKFNWHNTAFPQDDNHPVVNVSWRDAMAFCTWLTWKEGRLYRLPTEAEWEYACRAGTTTLFSCGDDPETLATVGNIADESTKSKFPIWHAIKAKDGFVFTAPVGSFKANPFGLFDMHGNAREWCSDWSSESYYSATPISDPPGPPASTSRVFRGGGWTSSPASCRSACRGAFLPSTANLNLGFRVAADLPRE
jgi:formylglycine-generating enzyme required for sulfatase activity